MVKLADLVFKNFSLWGFLLLLWSFPLPSYAQQTSEITIEKPHLKPRFFEEERRVNNQGFRRTFLQESLNGLSDPLGGGNAGNTGTTTSNSLTPLSPQQRGILPAFDPTDVIIPRPEIRR